MTKRKGHFQQQSHFISQLPIEECTRRLERLNDERVQIQITRMTSDKVMFEAQLYEDGLLRVESEGHLMRWEGTLTRVACRVTHIHDGVLPWALLMTAMLIIAMLIVPLIVFTAAQVDGRWWLAISGVAVAMILTFMVAAQRYTPFDDTPHNLVRYIERALTG